MNVDLDKKRWPAGKGGPRPHSAHARAGARPSDGWPSPSTMTCSSARAPSANDHRPDSSSTDQLTGPQWTWPRASLADLPETCSPVTDEPMRGNGRPFPMTSPAKQRWATESDRGSKLANSSTQRRSLGSEEDTPRSQREKAVFHFPAQRAEKV